MADVTVHQLESRCNNRKCFMNVVESDLFVSVEGSTHNKPTFLLRSGDIFWRLIQFESREAADEWLEGHTEYDSVLELTTRDVW